VRGTAGGEPRRASPSEPGIRLRVLGGHYVPSTRALCWAVLPAMWNGLSTSRAKGPFHCLLSATHQVRRLIGIEQSVGPSVKTERPEPEGEDERC